MESYIKMHKIFEKEAVMDGLIGASKELVIMTLGKPQKNYKNEMVYIAGSCFWGLYKRKLYLFFYKERLRDYYIRV